MRLFPISIDDNFDVNTNHYQAQKFDNCNLFRNLILIPIVEIPTSHMS